MESFNYVDIFATKGIEYILVIGYLILLVVFWRTLNKAKPVAADVDIIKEKLTGRLQIPKDFYLHKGHSWALQENDTIVKVGVNDFVKMLVGNPEEIKLPGIGSKLTQGENGWELKIDSKSIKVLSPVNGEVIAVNEEIVSSPEKISADPYKKGWLMKIKVPKMKTNFNNLLNGKLASTWIEEAVAKLREKIPALTMNNELGIVMPDGGIPVDGFIKNIPSDKWDEITKEFLLT